MNPNYNYQQAQQQPQQQKITPQYEGYGRGNIDNPYGKNPGQNYQQYDQSLNYIQQQQQAYNFNTNAPYSPQSYPNQNITPQLQPQNIPAPYNPRVPTDRSFVDQYPQY